MARRKKQRGGPKPEQDNADLEAPEHAWWAAGDTDPFAHPAEPEPAPEPLAAPEPAPADRDPYDVLRVDPAAAWDDIVAAHRKLVRRWHPDGLGPGTNDGEREYCVARMREVNEAYQAIRVRRNR